MFQPLITIFTNLLGFFCYYLCIGTNNGYVSNQNLSIYLHMLKPILVICTNKIKLFFGRIDLSNFFKLDEMVLFTIKRLLNQDC